MIKEGKRGIYPDVVFKLGRRQEAVVRGCALYFVLGPLYARAHSTKY
jgi:hypothetical protein